MPITILSKGYKKITPPAFGDLWFPAMAENIQLMNDHTHDGDDGHFIGKSTSDVDSGDWGADLGGGTYRQTVTMPDDRSFDEVILDVRRSTGERAYPNIVRVNATSFYIYTNDNSVSFTIYYV